MLKPSTCCLSTLALLVPLCAPPAAPPPLSSPGLTASAVVTNIVLENTSYNITPKLYTSVFSLYLPGDCV